MENTGKIFTAVLITKWYEFKPFIVKRTIRKLKKCLRQKSNNKAKIHTDTFISKCNFCNTVKITVYWRIDERYSNNKIHYGQTNECDYCWTHK